MTPLRALARLHGVQLSYRDYRGEVRHASDAAIEATLTALGVAVGDGDLAGPLARSRAELARPAPPVVTCWLGEHRAVRLRLPAGQDTTAIRLSLALEGGGVRAWQATPEASLRQHDGDGQTVVDVPLPSDLPAGYHALHTEYAGQTWRTLVIAAPPQAYQPEPPERWWGTFLPMYALRTERPWHAGDYSDLQRLVQWTGELGGQMAGTLPLLAGFLDGEPMDYSPYAPTSRLAWNELYIDVITAPELAHAPDAQALLADPAFQRALDDLGERRMVDYPALYRLKRRVLKLLAAALKAPGNETRVAAFEAYLRANPLVQEYARFRAVAERQGKAWQAWPEPLRAGALADADYDPSVACYHAYVQWLAGQQIAAVAPEGSQAHLYMDLPLGVHASGFDTWRFQHNFAAGASVGAPPDGLFVGGQDWGFPPLHPRRLREDSYRYVIEVVRHHMRHAGVLRIDHVMGLYRQFWIPQGFSATEGVYVRYPADELAAIVCLESHRNRCVVVGENLGTVPAAVERLLERRALSPMHVAQFGVSGDPARPFTAPAAPDLAAIGTHDTPTFAGWWYGLDIHDKLALGLVDAGQAQAEHAGRDAMRTAIEAYVSQHEVDRSPDDPPLTRWLAGTLRHLAESNAWSVLVNLEDLLLELQPQNVPGTHRERPNWLRKASATLEAIIQDPTVLRLLTLVNALRHR